MPALIHNFKFTGFILVLWLAFGWSQLVYGQGRLETVKYTIKGSQRHLILNIINPSDISWQPKVRVKILDSAGRIKHNWSFSQQIRISAGKRAKIELKWVDDSVASNKLERAEVYILDSQGRWRLEAWAHSRYQGSFMVEMFRFIPNSLSVVIDWIKTFPNDLISFSRKEVSLYAQRSA